MLRSTLLSSVALFGWLGLAAGSASAYDHHGGHHHHSAHHHHSHYGYSYAPVYRQPVVVVQRYSYPVSSCQYQSYSGAAYGGYGGYSGSAYNGYGGGYGSPYGGGAYGSGSGLGFYYSR